MKKAVSSLSWLLVGSGVLFVGSCSEKQMKPKQETKHSREQMDRGPEQNPFEHCDAEDSECEEGASSDVLQTIPEIHAVAETPSVATIVEPVHTQEPVSQPVAVLPQESLPSSK